MGSIDASQNGKGVHSWRLHQHLEEQVYGFRADQGLVTVSCERSPAKKTANEDSTLVMQLPGRAILLAVADGVGGLRGGELASQIALATLEQTVRGMTSEQSLRTAVVDGIELANRKILESQIAGASTIVVVTIEGQHVRTFHVGDSMALQISNRGRIKYVTVAHSPVGMAVEAGLLEESAAMHHEQRHLVNNIVGSESMRIEIGSTLELSARDTLVLASDGLYDNLLPDQIAALVRKGNLATAHRQLLAAVRERMSDPYGTLPSKADDLSVICYRSFGGKSFPRLQEITERLEG